MGSSCSMGQVYLKAHKSRRSERGCFAKVCSWLATASTAWVGFDRGVDNMVAWLMAHNFVQSYCSESSERRSGRTSAVPSSHWLLGPQTLEFPTPQPECTPIWRRLTKAVGYLYVKFGFFLFFYFITFYVC